MTKDEAQEIAVASFSALAADPERMSGFLELTGLRPDTLRQAAASAGFFSAVLDHVINDEALLIAIARAIEVSPERLVMAQQALSPTEHFT